MSVLSTNQLIVKLCNVDGCGKPKWAKGLCRLHGERMRLKGTTADPIKLTREEISERAKLGRLKIWLKLPKKVKRTLLEKRERKREMELIYWHKHKLGILAAMKAKRAIFRLANPLPVKAKKERPAPLPPKIHKKAKQTVPRAKPVVLAAVVQPAFDPAQARLAMWRTLNGREPYE